MKDQAKAYEICKIRGHESSGVTLTSDPPWSICKYCGTRYRYATKVIEMSTPEERIQLMTEFKSGG